MTWKAARLGCAILLGASVSACSEGVGSCEGEVRGRDTVLVGSTVVQFGGQAILNSACANGTCHTSTATGAARSGAPIGLDFDLVPVDEDASDGEAESRRGDRIVALSDEQIAGLRARQRKVVSMRDAIWQQVRDGLMPPDGMYEGYRLLRNIFDSEEGDACTKGDRYGSLAEGAAQEVLREWLACGAPLVEVNSQIVEREGVPGRVGRQYPMCGGGSVDGEPVVVSLETLLDGPLGTCSFCHPTSSPPDFTSLATVTKMVESDEEACDGKPYVTKGDPAQSFLYEVLSEEKPGCGVRPMPLGSRLTDDQRKLVYDWIAAGAPLTDDDLPAAPEPDDEAPSDADAGTPDGGTDAGARDAGARDAGARDAGARDAGARDAGARDAGR